MKINWGTSIVIAFALFVVKVQSNAKYDNELVVEEYYKKDAKYGAEMTRIQNAYNLTSRPSIDINNLGVSVVFPANYDSKKLTGKVSLYRPSNKKLDFEVPISITDSTLLIPKKSLVGGRWDITLEWEYDGVPYTMKEHLYLN
jgi:hypothetical protein